MNGEDRDEPQQPALKSLAMLASEALMIHNGDLAGAARMMAFILSRRPRLLDELVLDFLRRVQGT